MTWADVGARIRAARLDVGLDQAELARQAAIEPTALGRMEEGGRQVTAGELLRLSDALGVPVAQVIGLPGTAAPGLPDFEAPPRPEDPEPVDLDRALTALVDEADRLSRGGFLAPAPELLPKPTDRRSPTDPVAAAGLVRAGLGMGAHPAGSMVTVCGDAGLHLVVHPRVSGSASRKVGAGVGVGLVGRLGSLGERRCAAARELARFILADEDLDPSDEKTLEAFAAAFLLPDEGFRQAWAEQPPNGEEPATGEHTRLLLIAAAFRVPWATALERGVALGVIPPDHMTQLRALADRPGDTGDTDEAVSYESADDLLAGETSPHWRQATLAAWRSGAITAARALELLHTDG